MQNTYSKDGLVLDMSILKFRETGRDIIRDKSKHMNHGMCMNETNIIQTKEGIGAGSFDGVNDYVDCGNDASLNPTEAITVEVWAKFDVADAEETSYIPIIKRDNTFLLRKDEESNGKISFFIYDGTNWEPRANSYVQPNFGVWYHVVGTYDRQHIKIYVNGKLRGLSDRTNAIQSSESNTVVGFWNNKYFQGLIDEVRIYNRALSVEEVRGNMFTSKRYKYMRGVQKCGVR